MKRQSTTTYPIGRIYKAPDRRIKLCQNIINICSVSLQQGRFNLRHDDSELQHITKTIINFSTTNTYVCADLMQGQFQETYRFLAERGPGQT